MTDASEFKCNCCCNTHSLDQLLEKTHISEHCWYWAGLSWSLEISGLDNNAPWNQWLVVFLADQTINHQGYSQHHTRGWKMARQTSSMINFSPSWLYFTIYYLQLLAKWVGPTLSLVFLILMLNTSIPSYPIRNNTTVLYMCAIHPYFCSMPTSFLRYGLLLFTMVVFKLTCLFPKEQTHKPRGAYTASWQNYIRHHHECRFVTGKQRCMDMFENIELLHPLINQNLEGTGKGSDS